MSYDLLIFDSEAPVTVADVRRRMRNGDSRGTPATPRLRAFVTELSRRYLSLDDEDADLDRSPWTSGFDPDDDDVWLNIAWSRAQDVARHVATLAERHGVVMYDPQLDRVILPTRLGGDGKPQFDFRDPVPDLIAHLTGADARPPESFFSWLRSFFFGPRR